MCLLMLVCGSHQLSWEWLKCLRAAMATEPHKGISGLLVEPETTGSQFNIGSIILFILT